MVRTLAFTFSTKIGRELRFSRSVYPRRRQKNGRVAAFSRAVIVFCDLSPVYMAQTNPGSTRVKTNPGLILKPCLHGTN